MSTVTTVTDAATLLAALKASSPGDTILMSPGHYAMGLLRDMNLGGITLSPPPTGPVGPTVFTTMSMVRVSGVTFSGLEFDCTGLVATFAWQVTDSSNVSFINCNFHGDLSASSQDQTEGLALTRVSHALVDGCEFHGLYRGLAVSSCDYPIVSGNHFHDLARSAMMGANLTHARFTNNHVHDLHPIPGDHMDGLIISPSSGPNTTADVLIEGNWFWRGGGEVFQGVQMRVPAGVANFQQVAVRQNTFICLGDNGMLFYGVTGLVLDSNMIYSNTPTPTDPGLSWLLVEYSDQITATNNGASLISIAPAANHNTNWTETGSISLARLTDGGAALLAAANITN